MTDMLGMPHSPPTFTIGLAEADADLDGILAVQVANRAPTADGFVTVRHDLDLLRRMRDLAPSVVARDADGAVVGYALVMLREARPWIPMLAPMFARLDTLPIGERTGIADPRWYMMGQIAVAASHRGLGVFDAMYAAHRTHYGDRFDLTITEVAERNPRSMRAHTRVGFRTIESYDHDGDLWHIVALRLRESAGEAPSPA